MTVPAQATPQDTAVDKNADKEKNFRLLEQRYQRQLDQERQARVELENKINQMQQQKPTIVEDDDEPYVNHKKLHSQLSDFERRLEEKFEKKAEEKARMMLGAEKQQTWIKQNGDFYDVMKNADKLAEYDPELAETILEMPDSFERTKLVYKNLKALGLHKEKAKEPSIQEKIDANRRGAFYQPSTVSAAPYATQGDFSKSGQKSAYEQMKELQKRLRL